MQTENVRSLLESAARMGELANSRPAHAAEYSKAALDLTEAAMNAAKLEKLIEAGDNADLSVEKDSKE